MRTSASACGYLASLVSYRVLNYPMVALISPDTFLIVSLDEGEIEEAKGGVWKSRREGQRGHGNFCRARNVGEWYTHRDFNFRNVF